MTRTLGLVAALALGLAWCAAAEVPRPDAGDAQHVLFEGGDRPVLIRLHVRIDGAPFRAVHRAAWDDYLRALFRQLDQDGDGLLSEAEAQRLPPPPRLPAARGPGRQTNLAFNFRVVDADGNGKLDLAELAAYYRDYGGAGLQVSRTPPRAGPAAGGMASASEALFNRLDTDHDGRLSARELAAAEAVLLPLDADGDELITPAELLSPSVAPRPAAPRTMTLTGTARAGTAGAFRFLGPGMDPGPAGGVADRPPDVELLVRLGELGPGERPLEVLAGAALAQPGPDGTVVLRCGKARLEVRANRGRPALVPYLRRQYCDQFRAAAGAKGHLTFKDAQAAGFFPAQFALLDRNGDGQLTEQELLTYLDEVQERQAQALASGVAVAVSDEGRGLFDLLDRNRDGKLSVREIRSASQLLKQLGREGEGLSRADVPASYQLAVGLCQAGFDPAGGHGVLSPPGMPLLALSWARPGLVWFDKMDRNRDGDVSPREFLGSREDFRRLDADGDGLISLDEALRAERLFGRDGRAP